MFASTSCCRVVGLRSGFVLCTGKALVLAWDQNALSCVQTEACHAGWSTQQVFNTCLLHGSLDERSRIAGGETHLHPRHLYPTWIWESSISPRCVHVCVLVAQSCLTLWDPMDCRPPGPSIRGILQTRVLEWVAIPFSRGSSWLRDWTQVFLHCRQMLYRLSQQGSPSVSHAAA